MRRRLFQVSPSLMISPSPTSGNSACRICGVLRSKLSCSAIKACATVSGLLQTNSRRFSRRVEKNWYSKHLSSNTARKLRRAAAIIASGDSGLCGRSGYGGTKALIAASLRAPVGRGKRRAAPGAGRGLDARCRR